MRPRPTQEIHPCGVLCFACQTHPGRFTFQWKSFDARMYPPPDRPASDLSLYRIQPIPTAAPAIAVFTKVQQ